MGRRRRSDRAGAPSGAGRHADGEGSPSRPRPSARADDVGTTSDTIDQEVVVRTRATLADVAATAGVSQTTASRALAGTGRISEPTRRTVHEVASRLQYVPNAAARSLAIRRTGTLGLILVDFADP